MAVPTATHRGRLGQALDGKDLIRVTNHSTAPELVVNVRELLRSPGTGKRVDLTWSPADIATPVAAVDPSAPVRIQADIASVVEGLLVTGEVTATIRLTCARCLRESTDTARVGVRELFPFDASKAEDQGYTLLGDELPLDTLVRDTLVLAFPSAPLHDPDCAGLCPVCGADRNDVDCGHDQTPTDPRWAALAQLKSVLDEGGST